MRFLPRLILGIVLLSPSVAVLAQSPARNFSEVQDLQIEAARPASLLPDAPEAQQTQEKDPNSKQAPANEVAPASKQQPKRILGIMPNYRAVSAGAIPPPPTPKEAFKIATNNSFDYSSFVFVGLTSMIAEGRGYASVAGEGCTGILGLLVARICGQSRRQLLGDFRFAYGVSRG
jgi:hypothetical protein